MNTVSLCSKENNWWHLLWHIHSKSSKYFSGNSLPLEVMYLLPEFLKFFRMFLFHFVSSLILFLPLFELISSLLWSLSAISEASSLTTICVLSFWVSEIDASSDDDSLRSDGTYEVDEYSSSDSDRRLLIKSNKKYLCYSTVS